MARRLMARIWVGVGFGVVFGCTVDGIDLAGKACPCAEGWVCDNATQKCVSSLPNGGSGGSYGGTGGAGGTAGVGGTGLVGATGGKGGTGAKGGTGGIGASGATGGTGGSGACSPAEKVCAGSCVSKESPTYGCGAADCAPCSSYPGSTPSCLAGACAITCDPGYGNCDKQLTTGCETSLNVSDASNCGACNRTCSTNHATGSSCTGATCKPSCSVGWADCNESSQPNPDDGCEAETATNSSNCGACGNDCSIQGGQTAKFACFSGFCGCSTTAQCQASTGMSNFGCDAQTHTCTCNGTTCRRGEVCTKINANAVCSCNSGNACTAGQICCPGTGCKDIASDVSNCGACGLKCAPGQTCSAGFCF